jgi:beta-galactosidase
VGLDEKTGSNGSVGLTVLVDGRARDLGLKGDLTGSSAPFPIALDVTGAKEITLIVEFGQRGDVGDQVDWVNARLVK